MESLNELQVKCNKLEKEIFSEENILALKFFSESLGRVNTLLNKAKKVNKLEEKTKTELAGVIGLKVGQVTCVQVGLNNDLSRDYITDRLVKGDEAKSFNSLLYYYDGLKMKKRHYYPDNSYVLDGERKFIKGKNVIRTKDDLKYIIMAGETRHGHHTAIEGKVWLMMDKLNIDKVLHDFNILSKKYNIYKNRLITIVNNSLTLTNNKVTKFKICELGLSDEILKESKMIVKLFKNYKQLNKAGVGFRRNILLHGDPGNGKTELINSISEEVIRSGGTVFHYSLGHLVTSGRNDISELTNLANTMDPALVVLEDADLIGGDRSNGGTMTNDILKIFSENTKFIILASTNDINKLDPAFIRHGRMEKVFRVSLDYVLKKKIFEKHLEYYKLYDESLVDRKEVIEFLKDSFTSGAVINSLLMMSKQDLILDKDNSVYETIKNNIKRLTWQNGKEGYDLNIL